MKNTPKYSESAWENRELGASEEFVKRAEPEHEKKLDERVGLQLISIRLKKSLVDDLKTIAENDGIGYQPYIRQLLTKHVRQVQQEKREKSLIIKGDLRAQG